MLATPTAEYEGPTLHRFHCKRADEWLSVPWIVDGVLVYVADVASHLARAKAHGARVLSEMEDGPPGKRYRVEDLEGHRWMFMERPTQK
jgi:PhnB protein